jgi:hypothetical protein
VFNDDDPRSFTAALRPEAILAASYASDCSILGQPPARTIGINTSDMADALMSALSASFVYAFNLNANCHWISSIYRIFSTSSEQRLGDRRACFHSARRLVSL